MLSFEVKFYPSDPSQITDEQSRFVTICYLRASVNLKRSMEFVS